MVSRQEWGGAHRGEGLVREFDNLGFYTSLIRSKPSTHAWPLSHSLDCVLSCFSSAWLCNPMDCSPPGSSVYGIFQGRLLEWVAMPCSRRSSQPRDRTCISYISYVSCIGRWVPYLWASWMLLNKCLIGIVSFLVVRRRRGVKWRKTNSRWLRLSVPLEAKTCWRVPGMPFGCRAHTGGKGGEGWVGVKKGCFRVN